MFNQFETELYRRLQNFKLDDPTHEFGFSRHLMKNHGWTEAYTQKAIAEYQKFAFLTVVADHQVVPSDAVDQVWHAHVLLTQSYWEEFCPKILRKKLHHHPARGGKTERAEFHSLYTQTIASYRSYFGNPPRDIWSPPDLRFGKELRMQRISTTDNWIIPKYPLRKYLSNSSLVTGVVALILVLITIDSAYATSVEGTENGRSIVESYLYSYLCLFVPTIIGLALRNYIRQPSKQQSKPQIDLYQTAYLAGGSQRVVESAIVKLVHEGYLRPNVRNRTFAIAKPRDPEAHYLEHQVMDEVHRTPEFKDLRQADRCQISFLRKQLEQSKLLIEWNLGIVVQTIVGYLIILSICSFLSGYLLEESPIKAFFIESSISSLLFGILIIIACQIVPGSRTRWGDFVLSEIKQRHNWFDVVQRFALYGKDVLSGGALDDLKQIYQAQKKEDAGGCGCGC